MPVLETERLLIQPMSLDDAEDMFLIYSHEMAMRFIPYAVHTSPDETRQHFAGRLAGRELSQWSIRMKGSDRVIGAMNFIDARITGMGYIIHPDYWGQGVTVEACRALLDFAFSELDYDRIELWIDERNKASLRVAEKLGFRIKARFPLMDRHSEGYCQLFVTGMRRSEWRGEENESQEFPFYRAEPVFDVPDVQETVAFYRDKLGFTVEFLYGDPVSYAGVSRGEWTGNLVSVHFSQMRPGREFRASAGLHIRVGKDLDRLYEQYRDSGVTIMEEPEDKSWGFREFVVSDLNGYRLVFAAYL